jgi:hypothetical protein
MEIAVQRLMLGDVILVELPPAEGMVEATVVRAPVRDHGMIRVLLRAGEGDDVVAGWPVSSRVTVVRGP